MPIYPSPDILDEKNKYELVILTAKRAKQLRDGGRKLIDTDSSNALTVALEELASGAVQPRLTEVTLEERQKVARKPAVPTDQDIVAAGPVITSPDEMDFSGIEEPSDLMIDTIDDSIAEDDSDEEESGSDEEDDERLGSMDED